MKFSKAQEEYQKQLNERILVGWDEAITYFEDCYKNHFPNWKRLKYCSAEICHLNRYVYLKSYNSLIAVFDTYNFILYDCLRYVYGYTATSAHHISKFYNEMRYEYHLSPNEIELCRYYRI